MHRYKHKATWMTKKKKKSRKHGNTKAKQWFYTFKVLKEKKKITCQPRILYPEKVFSSNEREALQDKN